MKIAKNARSIAQLCCENSFGALGTSANLVWCPLILKNLKCDEDFILSLRIRILRSTLKESSRMVETQATFGPGLIPLTSSTGNPGSRFCAMGPCHRLSHSLLPMNPKQALGRSA